MEKMYIICNKDVEVDRFKNMEKQIEKAEIPREKIEYFCKYWKNDIEELKKNDQLIYDNYAFSNLNFAEISLLINHIEILKHIRKNYKEGLFLILESDAYVYPDMTFTNDKINKLLDISEHVKPWDLINVGSGVFNILGHEGYPKSEPILIDNFKFYRENRNICTEGVLWNYNSICKFLNLFQEYHNKNNKKIVHPIDVIMNNLIINKELDILWMSPSFVVQGSGTIWKSNIR